MLEYRPGQSADREQDVSVENGWEPPHFEPGTRVMVRDDKFDPRKNGLVGIVRSGDPYPGDARFPKRSPYVTIAPENYYFGRMFFSHTLLHPYDGESVRQCIHCGHFHWEPGTLCERGRRFRESARRYREIRGTNG